MTSALAPDEGRTPREGLASLLRDLIDLVAEPRAAFLRLARAPRIWSALALFVVQQLAFTAVWLSKLDVVELLRSQAAAAGQPLPTAEEVPVAFVRGAIWASSVTVAPGMLVVMALAMVALLNFALGRRVSFRQSLSVVLHTFLVVFFVYLPLALLTMALKGEWSVDPQQVLIAGPALLLSPDTSSRVLYTIASAADIFSLWIVVLLASGYRAVTGRPTLGLMLVLWALWIACKAAWTALIG